MRIWTDIIFSFAGYTYGTNILYYLLFMQEWEFVGETGIKKGIDIYAI